MKSIMLAGAAMFAFAIPALAANVVTFGQTAQVNTITATVNGTNTQTTLDITDAALSIGQLLGGGPIPATVFNLDATSNDAATPILGAVIQHFDGSFCISTGLGCTGTTVLAGVFSDAAFGALGGPGLTVNVNSPPDTLVLSSDIFTAAQLASPNAFSLGFTNLSPALAIVGTTIAPFDASFAGTVSASVVETAEPATLAMLGVGLLGLGLVRSRSREAR
jgi:hypothetical protein